ncbi:hypothetical protein ABI428_38450, partial [Pseudomonas aeruginosa]
SLRGIDHTERRSLAEWFVQSVIPGHAAFSALIRSRELPDKTRKSSHQALIAGCGVNALSGLQSSTLSVA